VPVELPVEDEGLTVLRDAARSSARGRDRWEWIRPVLRVASGIMPLACAVVALTDGGATPRSRILSIVVAAAFSGWLLALHPKVCESHDNDALGWPLLSLAGAYVLFAGQ